MMPETPKTTSAAAAAPAKPSASDWYRVVLTHPSLNRRTVFRSLSETRARKFIQDRYPRGSEAHLVFPNGTIESYEAERTGERGADAPQWTSFSPEDWVPVEQAPPPGQDEWADKEG